MKKSILLLTATLRKKLVEFPVLVNALEKKEPDFIIKLFNWVQETEATFTTHNIFEVSALAGFRSKILAPKYCESSTALNRRKIQWQIAAETLYDIQNLVLSVMRPVDQKVQECRELIRQLMQIISQSKIIKYDANLPFENLITEIWNLIISNEQLKAGGIKLKTILPTSDIHMLIAEEIDLEDF